MVASFRSIDSGIEFMVKITNQVQINAPKSKVWEHLLLRVDLISPHGHADVAAFNLLGSYALLLLLIIPIVGFYIRRRYRSERPVFVDLKVK